MLEAVFGNSPFLGRCLLAEPTFVQFLVEDGPDAAFAHLTEDLGAAAQRHAGRDALMRALRVARRRAAVAAGIADITGVWTVEQVTRALSNFADAAIGAAAAFLLREAAEAGAFSLPDLAEPESGSGLAILGMGKLGGRELNYSSDIDLIVLFDRERIHTTDPARLQETFVRLTRDLVRMLQDRTADGYVFRTDLRLRPDPGATPLAISTLAAETYYESIGQNWERAALIKARPVAGDLEAGRAFLDHLRPFIWRKNLDFAAIQDIHSIKRQIAARRGGSRIAVAGHNIKLGRGGIREIEFFAQTQQLIWGGRDPSLRAAPTCESLEALVAAGRIEKAVADDLIAAYRFLRRVEHRLQMVEDQQIHTIPKDENGIAALACFLGYDGDEAFSAELLHHLHRVEDHYRELFEDSGSLSEPGNLVFTGGEHDPDTLATLAEMGFRDPERVSTIVRQWHHGRYRATSTTRAREILTELMPTLLGALARTADPDAAFVKFNGFLAGLPAGVQLFSLFQANPQLLDVVAEIMGSAPFLAELLARKPALLDGIITHDFMSGPPSRRELEESLADEADAARDFEDLLDIVRRWTNDQRFQMGVQILLDITDADEAGPTLADIADVALGTIHDAVERDFARRHGRVRGAGLVVVAYGKYGGRELAPGSDLDLVFVFDCPEGAAASDGPKALTPGHYFARLGQSLISAVTSPTAEGKLYEVDMRLRPHGNAGPLVPRLQGYIDYLAKEAWTWELMALTRARPVSGPAEARARVATTIRERLCAERPSGVLATEVSAMRERMAQHHKARSIWDIKHLRGGLVDIEFLAQYLMLRHAHAHPDVLDTNTTGALAKLKEAEVVDDAVADELTRTMRLWRRVHGMLRLTFGSGSLREEDMPEELRRILARAGEAESFSVLKEKLTAAADTAHAAFVDIVEAAAAAAAGENRDETEAKP